MIDGEKLSEMQGDFQHFSPSSRVGTDVLHRVREAWRRTRSEGDAEFSLEHDQIQELWGFLDEGLQKQLTGSEVQRRNYGQRH